MGHSALLRDAWALGCYLVNELKIADRCDTLRRWMAHHLAMIIVEAHNSTSEEYREQRFEEARQIIIELCLAYNYSLDKLESFLIAESLKN